jgi:hypothetical protein
MAGNGLDAVTHCLVCGASGVPRGAWCVWLDQCYSSWSCWFQLDKLVCPLLLGLRVHADAAQQQFPATASLLSASVCPCCLANLTSQGMCIDPPDCCWSVLPELVAAGPAC